MSSDDPTVPLGNKQSTSDDMVAGLEERVRKLEDLVARRGYDTRPVYEKHETEIKALQNQVSELMARLSGEGISIESTSRGSEGDTRDQTHETNQAALLEDPTVFFSQRTANAFPGVRGLQWFDDPEEVLRRLSILLKPPLGFRVGSASSYPIWWWRGLSNMQVHTFETLSKTKVLMNFDELEIKRAAVYRSASEYREFVYVETKPDQPVGIRTFDDVDLGRKMEMFGYASEEYALFGETPITREEYDDGAAVVAGTVVTTAGVAKLRVRYLTPYNLILASHLSPINYDQLDETFQRVLDGILKGVNGLEEIVKIMEEAPRNRY